MEAPIVSPRDSTAFHSRYSFGVIAGRKKKGASEDPRAIVGKPSYSGPAQALEAVGQHSLFRASTFRSAS
jgi:hypothetical protein